MKFKAFTTVQPLLSHGDSKMHVAVNAMSDEKIKLEVVETATGESKQI